MSELSAKGHLPGRCRSARHGGAVGPDEWQRWYARGHGSSPPDRVLCEASLDAAALNAVDEAASAIDGLLDVEDALSERAESIGATMNVESGVGEGTRIIVALRSRADA